MRVGVIGCGLIAQVMHLPYLRELRDLFELVALCDASPGTLAGVADAYDVRSRFLDWSDMLDESLDGVMVLTGGSHAPAGHRGGTQRPACLRREADVLHAARSRRDDRGRRGVAGRPCSWAT